MSENTTNKNLKDDEIDLLDLFHRMGKTLNKWASTIGIAFLITIVFLLKRWLPISLSIIIGAGVSYLIKTTSATSYTADLVFRNNLVLMDNLKERDNSGTTSELISKINKLHTLCSENDTAKLSSALFMRTDLVTNVSDISAYWIIDKSRDGIPDYVDYRGNFNVYDTINIRMPDRLGIRVIIKTPQDLDLVRNGIIKFIESDSLFQQRNRVRLMQNQQLLKRLGYDIEQLDSLQKVKYFEETRNLKPASSGQIVFMQEQKTQLVYNDIYNLYGRKQQLEFERDLYNGVVTVLSDFSSPARNNGGSYYAKKYIPLSFVLTLLVLIILANWSKLTEVYKKY